MNWKQNITDFFSFTVKDRIGALLMLLIIAALTFIPMFISRYISKKPAIPDAKIQAAEKMLEERSDSFRTARPGFKQVRNYPDVVAGELFYFDPNTLDETGWKKLGIREKTIATILKFRSRGGKFRSVEDLKKIYGLRKSELDRIIGFVRISTPVYSQERTEKPVVRELAPIDINTADTSGFISLPGIGNKLAGRIVLFREKLGGFHSIEQVKEVYGLQDSVFLVIRSRLVLANPEVRKININKATVEELRSHPYIRWAIANPVVAYRNEHGEFKNVFDLKNIMAVTDEIFKKLEPYITVE